MAPRMYPPEPLVRLRVHHLKKQMPGSRFRANSRFELVCCVGKAGGALLF